MAAPPPLVVLGYDFADPELLVRWAQEGHLPTLAGLMERGSWARTRGPDLMCEHGAWTSVLSGIPLSEHGYYYFRRLVPGTYDLRTATPRDAHAQPFWAHLAGTGRRVAIVDAPTAEPLAGLEGLQLADWATHLPAHPPSAEPASVLGKAERLYGPRAPTPQIENEPAARHRELNDLLHQRVARKGTLCRSLLAGTEADVTVAVFSESHPAGHHFWQYLPQGHRGGGEDGLGTALRDLYAAIDREMGLLLGVLPAAANVFVVSSAGLQGQYPTLGVLDAMCRALGYRPQATGGGGAKKAFSPMALARRIVPERVRIRLSRRLSREARERILSAQFRGETDWSATTAFAIPSFYNGFLRVNLRGREPEGTVEPGEEYLAVLERLEADLAQLTAPESGEPVLGEVVRAIDLTGGEPPQELPDLFVMFKPHRHFLERVSHPRAELTQEPPELFRDTHHSQSGLVVGAGPSVAAGGELGEISPLDLAPTLLSMLGERPPPALAGRALEAFGAGRELRQSER